jgi:hypothetical protein
VAVAEGSEALDQRGQVGSGGDHDVEVDDGLGGQAGDGRAADVLDADGQGAEGAGQAVAELGEAGRPAGS